MNNAETIDLLEEIRRLSDEYDLLVRHAPEWVDMIDDFGSQINDLVVKLLQ